MLRKLNVEEFDKYIEFIYNLAIDITKSGYPTYADGIKTKEDFVQLSYGAFNSQSEEILLFEIDGKVLGWIHYYFIPNDRYLSTYSFQALENINVAIKEFEIFCKLNFASYNLWLGFPKENEIAIEYLSSNNYSLIEKSHNDVLFLGNYIIKEESNNIQKVTEKNFHDFKVLHDFVDSNMYWTSNRLLKNLDRWNIYLYYENNIARGAIYFTNHYDVVEIFGVDYENNIFNEFICYELMVVCLNECKKSNIKYLNHFTNDNEHQLVLNIGFKNIGGYNYFRKQPIDFKKNLEIMRENFAKQNRFERLKFPPYVTFSEIKDIKWEYEILLSKGKVYYANIAQANTALFKFGFSDCPAVVVYSMDESLESDPLVLSQYGRAMYRAKIEKSTNQAIEEVGRDMRNERVYSIKRLLPKEITANIVAYHTTIMILRKHLPKRRLVRGLLPVLISDETKNVLVLPKKYWSEEFTNYFQDKH